MQSYLSSDDTIVALATPSGKSAIAVIRLSGKDSINIVNKIFKGINLLEKASHTAHYGFIVDNEKVIDEVLVTVFHENKSYTKENSVEISAHGSPFIVQETIKLLLNKGARYAEPGEFTRRAFLNGRFNLSQAEAVADLINSEAELSHKNALNQLRGGFSVELSDLRNQLIKFCSLIELELDFGEEDIEFAQRDDLKQFIIILIKKITPLIESFKLGNVIKKGIPITIAGKPNAGKSTLLNTLLNEEKAIVSNIPGTTRDIIEDVLNIDGITFRFIDTAGIRNSENEIEIIGIQKTFSKMDEAAIIVYLIDLVNSDYKTISEEINNLEKFKDKLIITGNKHDEAENFSDFNNLLDITISAEKKINIEKLKLLISNKIKLTHNFDSETIITNVRHYENLTKTHESLKIVLENLDKGYGGELLAHDLRNSLYYIGLISGDVSNEDLLDSIFRDFCIGK